tara:strand:+ start:13227 stop:13349 length:123 start_codon:yes stop_codon:yes gene_type:complete
MSNQEKAKLYTEAFAIIAEIDSILYSVEDRCLAATIKIAA